jgi:hypothetical protein
MNKLLNVLIGLITILIILWSILYVIPSILISFFHTILGNIIVFLIVYLISTYNINYGIGIFVLFIILYQISNKREYLSQQNKWSDKTIYDFLLFQKKINPGIVFDTSIIQEQSTESEAKELLKTGMWPWSSNVKQLYMDAVSHNPYIRTSPEDSTNNARTIYNQNAILQVLQIQSKKGQFLLNGIKQQSDVDLIKDNTFGINSGLIANKDTLIRCATNKETDTEQLLKIKYIGNDGLFRARQYETTFLEPSEIENNIKGFHFTGEQCNPCSSQCSFEL